MTGSPLNVFRYAVALTGCVLMLCALPQAARALDLLNDIGEGLQSIGDAVGDSVKEGVKGGVAISKGAKLRGQYYMAESRQTVSCFDGIKVGYILPPGATSPGAPGTRVTALDCDKLASQGLLTQGPIWPGESKPPAAGGDGYSGGYNEANCPGIGNRRTAKEIRAYAKCVDRDAGFDDDWDALKKKHMDAAAANQQQTQKKIQNIQDNANKEFARIQAKAAADAAAAKAQAAAQGQ